MRYSLTYRDLFSSTGSNSTNVKFSYPTQKSLEHILKTRTVRTKNLGAQTGWKKLTVHEGPNRTNHLGSWGNRPSKRIWTGQSSKVDGPRELKLDDLSNWAVHEGSKWMENVDSNWTACESGRSKRVRPRSSAKVDGPESQKWKVLKLFLEHILKTQTRWQIADR